MTVEPGRSGENWDDLPRIAAGDSFDFACAGCGGCCRGRRDLVLSGYDLYRIARRLGLSPRIVAGAFCKSYLAPQTLLPALRLKPANKPVASAQPAPSMRRGRWPVRCTRWGRASTL